MNSDAENRVTEQKPERGRKPLAPGLKKLLIAVCAVAAVAAAYAAAAGIAYPALKNSRPMSDAELVERMKELIPAAAEINTIVWGEGLPVDPDAAPLLDSVTGHQYRPVSPDSPYQSTDELRRAIAAVYSDELIRDHINYIAFDGSEGAIEGYKLYPRYADKKQVNADGSTVDRLNVDVNYKSFELKSVIFPETAEFVCREPEWNGVWWTADRVTVRVEEEYAGDRTYRELSLRLRDGAWMLDSPTY